MALGTIAISIVINQDYKTGLDQAEKAVNDLAKTADEKLKKAFNGGNEGLKKLTDQANELTKVGKKFEDLGKQIEKVGNNVKDIGTEISKVSLPVAAGIGFATKAFIDFEDELSNVKKSTNATNDELKSIGTQLLEVSKNTRTSAKDLTVIATVGGQLGIGAKDIVAFTSAIDKLNVSLGDEFSGGVEQVTNSVGGLRAIFKDVRTSKIDQDLLKIGNAINELGKSGLATGEIMTSFATRIGGAGANLGLTISQTLGLSAALQELQVAPERGSSAVVRVLGKIGENINTFAKLTGKSAKEFANIFNTDVNQALLLVAESARKSSKNNVEFIKTLDDLGLDGVYTTEVLSKLGANIDLVKEKQTLAGKAIKETTSIQDEFNTRNTTTAAVLAQLRNRLNVLGVTLGAAFGPAVLAVADKLSIVMEKVVTAFENLPNGTKQALVGIALFVAAIGPVLVVIGSLISSVGTVVSAIGGLTTVLGGVVSTITALGAPVIALVAGITALAIAFTALGIKFGLFQQIGEKLKELFFALKQTYSNFQKAFEDPKVQIALQSLQNAFEKLENATKPIFTSITKLIDQAFKPMEESIKSNEGALVSEEGAVSILTKTFDGLAKVIEFITPLVQVLSNTVAFLIDEYTKAVAKIQEFINNLREAFADPQVQKAIEELKTAFSDLKTTASELWSAIKKLGEALGFYSKENDTASNSVQNADEKAKEHQSTIQTLVGIITTVVKAITFFTKVLNLYGEAYTWVIGKITEFVEFIKGIPERVKKFVEDVQNKFEELKNNVGEKFNNIKKSIGDTFDNIKTSITNKATEIKNNVIDAFNGIINFFVVTIPAKFNEAIEKVKEIWNRLPEIAFKIGEQIGFAIGTIVKFFIDLPGNIADGVQAFVDLVVTKFTEFKDKALEKGKELVDGVVQFFTELPGRITDFIQNLVTLIVTKFTEFKDAAVKKVSELVNNVITFFQQLPDKIRAFVEDLKNKVVDKFNEIKDTVTRVAREVIDNVVNFFKELPGKISDEVQKMTDAVVQKFNELKDKAYNFGKDFVESIVNGIKAVGNKVSDTVNGLFNGIKSGFDKAFSNGGVVGFATGGVVPKVAYAADGMFTPKGTDTVPAMLTPGELVVPRNLTSQLFSLLKSISSLPNANRAGGFSSSQVASGLLGQGAGININIGNVNASNADEARRRAGDLGFFTLNHLRSKGIK